MEIKSLLELYASHPGVKATIFALKNDRSRNIFLEGLAGSSGSFVVSSVFKSMEKHTLCVLNDAEDAGYFYHDLCQLIGEEKIFFFPSGYRRAIRYGQEDPASNILRTEVLSKLQKSQSPCVVVSYPEALAEKVISKDSLQENTLKISKNEKVDSIFVEETLYTYGFDRVEFVYEPGQFAVRGSIIDVFSYSSKYPYRIDFFGDEVESIRTFDVETQLSEDRIEEFYIIPGKTGNVNSSLLSYLPEELIVVFRDRFWVHERIASLWNEEPILQNEEMFQTIEEIRAHLITAEDFHLQIPDFKTIYLSHSGKYEETLPSHVNIQFNVRSQIPFHKNFNLISDAFSQFLLEGYKLYILSDSQKQIDRIKAIFEDRGDNISFIPVSKTIHEGFYDIDFKLCFFTDHQLFDRFHRYNLKTDKINTGKLAISIKEITQFQIGDYIIHVDHGVGKFGGLIRTEINGKMQEVIKLIYQNDDIIFVSIHSLHKLSKFRGKEGEPPKLNKLGSGVWETVKERTKSKVKDIARDLIILYSKRRAEKGFAFSPDSYLQQELEASFTYEDTPDQLKATEDVKSDMEKDRPMDRLICGDVGFGKTEVAIRAAFKAVADNKQVAVLVPTTLLAYQHYQTFKKRLEDFPCTIDYISRTKTHAKVMSTLEDLKEGKIDILIGTHRIVSKDVKFKDLGLLIIDEEQKFGVNVKDQLKHIKINVDVLTLTATPIPRTLQFSLMGARDLSSIMTPPPNRRPVQTEIHTFNETIIKEAINFEMSREGQVFIINNRVQNIYETELLIKKIVPDARIAVGHGQMKSDKLEKIVSDFIKYQYDVLIATTIIENGIDIPNANTIIVNNAHNFGLSDLHQLRGRVGRSDRKAFCYLLAPPLHMLTLESRRRLQAIENFSGLGSGIHISMQDLDIRGAGNMLGDEQSGFIADMGYETYQKILEEAVQELKNEEFSELYKDDDQTNSGENYVKDTVIDSDMELLFPANYIRNDSERILLYKELDSLESEMDIEKFIFKLEDRFGKIPKEGKELIRVVRLKRVSKKLGAEKVILKMGKMHLYLVNYAESPFYQSDAFGKIIQYIQENYKNCQLREVNNRRVITIDHINNVETACAILNQIYNTPLNR